MEAAAFRVGQVARRLLADHPGLSVRDLEPTVWSLSCGIAVTQQLEITPDSIDGVRAWAEALGVEVKVAVQGKAAYAPYKVAKFKTEIDGVEVEVGTTGVATDDEVAAWRAERDQAGAEFIETAPVGAS
ncbi:hypothetical protein AB0H77_03585 [Streptomyces sp. NPDC050844]|uniref:hypothetical protein n=1 Tax=Streptomyces sp. NPDC050844 TaxID=3155790 RepID=UPI0033C3B409